ncbi:MAG: YifB family Mg chelatase-like AAA ATPase [Clostridia bacterium]|nr:YifB family Mg chelatase-like AAA ATPase [Clostridia bacterium]MDD4048875.1 YifB family Mg chelatase-like AAA ATPase [Clostridia bacterium]
MLARVFSCTTIGVDSHIIEVEVDASGGLPEFTIVGLPDTTVKESKERVRAAIKNAGFDFPPRKLIVNLAPADIKKEGSVFDLAIAIGILAATGQLEMNCWENHIVVGELSLDGSIRKIPGILPMGIFINKNTDRTFIVPEENKTEVALTPVKCYSFTKLEQVKKYLENPQLYKKIKQQSLSRYLEKDDENVYDFSDVKGQQLAKRALEVAAAGGHNVLLIGSPGCGKSMLAKCFPSILPPLTPEEALEVSKIYSIAGLLNKDRPLITKRPFRAPHHSASPGSIIGGGLTPSPGEVTLATNGVLFLDEMPEYRRDVLESLRQPLEDRVVTISRISAVVTYPAVFQLVAAANPCYCGYYGDKIRECTCTPYQVNKYRSKISGPLLDRIDLQVEVPRLEYKELQNKEQVENSQTIRERVIEARERQLKRLSLKGINNNAQMSNKDVGQYCQLGNEEKDFLKKVYDTLGMSVRTHERILKISRTIADLAGTENISIEHISEALQYRTFDRS